MTARYVILNGVRTRYEEDGSQDVLDTPLALAFDYTADGHLQYMGRAVVGSLTSDAVWQIEKYVYDATPHLIAKQWADGDSNYDNVWDNRASLTYV